MKEYQGKEIYILKANGDKVAFREDKLKHSLEKAGADENTISLVIAEVKQLVYEGMNSTKIFNKAYQLLKKRSGNTAMRYRMKRAVMELGPTGYPFERFIGELLKFQGFKVQVGEIVQGNCVQHEVDVVAEKEHKHYMIECKFHNRPGFKCDIKVALYIHARFLDIEKKWQQKPGHGAKFHQGWVVTNTEFTSDAISYANCVGMNLIGWNYPNIGSLQERIEVSGLYPITCLTTISKKEKKELLDNNFILCSELLDSQKADTLLESFHSRADRIRDEARRLCLGKE